MNSHPRPLELTDVSLHQRAPIFPTRGHFAKVRDAERPPMEQVKRQPHAPEIDLHTHLLGEQSSPRAPQLPVIPGWHVYPSQQPKQHVIDHPFSLHVPI
ncbi:MAG TPA: hypothetical protein VFB99_08525 [Vicinamibacterales bacterium]|nr:hypothetical protein [Vicinamibacterales bacterium]